MDNYSSGNERLFRLDRKVEKVSIGSFAIDNSDYCSPMPITLSDKATVETLIAERHWAKGESLRAIERDIGVGKTTLCNWCKRHGIAVRSRVEQTRISSREPAVVAKRSGENHWAWGLRRPAIAERMRANNPMHMVGVRDRAIAAQAVTMRRNMTDAERFVSELFPGGSPQHPVGHYILDLAFVEARVDLEIDGKNHWARGRQASDAERDAWLVGEGWRVVRIDQDRLARPAHLIKVLDDMIPGLQVASHTPREALNGQSYKYRVLVRDAQDPAGRHV